MKNEHTTYTGDSTLGSATKDWLHKAGSAVAFHAATASAPATRLSGEALADGQLWYDTTAGILKVYSSGSWVSISGSMPIGTIMYFSGSFTNNVTFPGWYKCDGTNGTPDLITNNRFARAASASGGTGGSKSISVGNLPAHDHNIGVGVGVAEGGHPYGTVAVAGITVRDATTATPIDNKGSGTDYWQPYMDLIPIIRIS